MLDRTSTATIHESSVDQFPLSKLQRGQLDKLGNTVQAIMWFGESYAIYRSDKGVYVHFSDRRREEREQRKRFAEICPELCELRYLTSQMKDRWWHRVKRAPKTMMSPYRKHALYEHNIAQALMLLM